MTAPVAAKTRIVLASLALALLPTPALAQATSTEAEKLFAPVGSDFQSFGRDVVVQGDVALITANGDQNSGRAYAYRRVGGNWTLSQAFKGPDTAQGDFFGFEADMGGNWAVIGSPQNDGIGANSGAAYVSFDNGTAFSHVQKIVAVDGAASDQFGWSVAVDGNLMVIGSASDSDDGASSGSAYVYRQSGGVWFFEQKLTASTADTADQFGWDVETDGEIILVSSVSDEEPGQGETGAVFAFAYFAGAWNEVQRFVAPDAMSGDRFGWDIELDGNVLAVAGTDHDQPVADGGAIWVYRFNGSFWAQEQKLAPSKLAAGASLGFSVALQDDRLVAGAPGTGATFSGALYQFHHDGSAWVEVHQWLSSDESAPVFPPAQLGMSCAIDGNTIFGGAPFGDGAVINSGAAYRYELTDLGLDAVPDAVPLAGAFQLETYGGLAFNPMGIFLTEVSGFPFNILLLVTNFDAAGQQTLPLLVPAAASGFDATFLSFGFWQPGFKTPSNTVKVDFL
jgi:hypothetical protein